MKSGYSNMRCGLLGEHLTHSFSPRIHKMLCDYEYNIYDIAPDSLEDFVKNGGVDAFNVTIPYKKAVFPFIDEISPEAKAIGAINVVVIGNHLRSLSQYLELYLPQILRMFQMEYQPHFDPLLLHTQDISFEVSQILFLHFVKFHLINFVFLLMDIFLFQFVIILKL